MTTEKAKLAVEYDEAQIADYLKQGYVIVSHDDFNKLIGNDNGEYLIADDGSVYPKPAPVDAELLPAAKLANSLKSASGQQPTLRAVLSAAPAASLCVMTVM